MVRLRMDSWASRRAARMWSTDSRGTRGPGSVEQKDKALELVYYATFDIENNYYFIIY